MNWIRRFADLGKGDSAIAGGKGASLGEMTQVGIPVPSGFVVVATAFERFLQESELHTQIDAVLHNVNHQDIASVETAAAEIKALILHAEMPKDIAMEIQHAHHALGEKFVAVRSSATAEDSVSAAWAGQLDTYLNTAAADLLENVQHCWASLFTPRAIFYRFEKNLHEQHISVAVVVQEMVASEVSGIAFSVHPVTEDHNQLIIEAGYGLGEAIVSGQITPDSYVVEKDSCKCIEKNVSTQEKKLVRAERGGNVWQQIPAAEGVQQKLTDTEVLELAQLIVRIEQHYGFPVDVEWARAKGKWFITQSRPITTLNGLVPFSVTEIAPSDPLATQLIAEHRLDQSTWTHKAMHAKPHYFYVCMEEAMKPLKKYYGDAYRITLFFIHENYVDWYWNAEEMERLRKSFITKVHRNPKYLTKFVRDWHKRLTVFRAEMRKVDRTDLTALSDAALWKCYKRWYDAYVHEYALAIGIQDAFSMHADRFLLPHLAEKITAAGHPDEVNAYYEILTAPDTGSFVTEERKDFLKLRAGIKKMRALTPANRRAIDAHVRKWYWMNNNYAKAQHLDAAHFIRALGKITDNPKMLLKQIAKNFRDAQQRKRQLIKTLKLDRETKNLIRIAEVFTYMQDERKRYVLKAIHYLDQFLTEYTRRTGILKADLEFTHIHELPALMRSPAAIAPEEFLRRKEFFFIITHKKGPQVYSGATARAVFERVFQEHHSNVVELKGQVAMKGKAIGIAKIVRKFHDLVNVRSGDIFIASMTRPEMTPALHKVAAIVTDEGGVTSHAAIVSRELGIPCIIGTKIATQVFKDGDRIEVDANIGVVRKL